MTERWEALFSRSKFRILFFALDAGVVKDEFRVFPWDGVKEVMRRTIKIRTCARLCDILHSGCMKNLLRRSVREKHGPT